ncbi:YceI-like domain-containing protein [Mesonia phycicola]|uniref:YceI-like domain-containing protein n=1 Tax=Mesonia phycicola TaxID=579105 RepID=A0A1M6G781_9FLAO|nr:YceI family protein [Mesonia phycicola]SHJ05838.1 YceI-like domain-containing protein [Mesonia phycicola]
MRLVFILSIMMFGFFNNLKAQSGMVEIKVETNVNQFTCLCEEISFICAEFNDNDKVLKLPVSSFSCPKRLIEKDLVELFEAEKYPHISIEILEYTETQKNFSAEIKITIKETEKVYQLLLSKTYYNGVDYFTGKQSLNLTDYYIEPPVKALGLVKVKPIVNIEFRIPEEFVVTQ